MKSGVRILSIDDSPFRKGEKRDLVIGIVSRGSTIEGILSFYVEIDGSDATDKILKKVKESRFSREIKLIAINGITLAGLNIVDIKRLSEVLGVPVIAITRRKPNKKAMENAIKNSGKDARKKILLLREINSSSNSIHLNGLYIQYIGISRSDLGTFAGEAYQMLRLAHLIASGLVKGESRGRI
ncbi:MAG: DUF99 family protein [Candidatus Micrarchaeia archaeon]